MDILGVNGGHDGAVVSLKDSKLIYAREAEKGSRRRHSALGGDDLLTALEAISQVPDVVAHSGWWKGVPGGAPIPTGAGYFGLDAPAVRTARILGRSAEIVTTSHERSHVWCSLGLSKVPVDSPCQVLLWEGEIGCYYRVTPDGAIRLLGSVLTEPGSRYLFPYALADPSVADDALPAMLWENAGKSMALAAFCDDRELQLDAQDQDLLDKVCNAPSIYPFRKSQFRSHPLYNVGVEAREFKKFARGITNELFARFWSFALKNLDLSEPLVIGGGCGLNCEWNTRFREGWRSDVFVPPCPNDSGVALGAAIDAQQLLGGPKRIEWSASCGPLFERDREPSPPWVFRSNDPDEIARVLAVGAVLGWVTGRVEMGPRALGNRSILAAPFQAAMTQRLNQIKLREGFRPIAPICQLERVSEYFDWVGESPHMLYFQKVICDRLEAVTHVDRTARAQTVARDANPRLWELLESFRKLTGYAVMCNTSLNLKGLGFVNSMTELEMLANSGGMDGFVVEGDLWMREDFAGTPQL